MATSSLEPVSARTRRPTTAASILPRGGFAVFATRDGGVVAASLATLISLMHFWYDGFIGSVQKRQV